jgi:hypothetical protein
MMKPGSWASAVLLESLELLLLFAVFLPVEWLASEGAPLEDCMPTSDMLRGCRNIVLATLGVSLSFS